MQIFRRCIFILEQYRPELIEMKRRYFSQREMAEKVNPEVKIKLESFQMAK